MLTKLYPKGDTNLHATAAKNLPVTDRYKKIS